MHGRLQKFLQYPNEIVGAGQGVWHTFDFGAFWEEDQSFIGAEPVYAFQNHPIYKNIIWLGGEGLFFDPILGFSTDGGYNWTEIYLGGIVPYDNAVYSMAFDLVDPNIVYVGMQGAIIKTTDRGQTWISPLVTHPQGEFFYSILADHANEWHLWATAGIDIIETWDKGESWQLIENPLPLTTRISDMIWDQSAEVIYLATFHNGVYSLKP